MDDEAPIEPDVPPSATDPRREPMPVKRNRLLRGPARLFDILRGIGR